MFCLLYISEILAFEIKKDGQNSSSVYCTVILVRTVKQKRKNTATTKEFKVINTAQ